MKFSLSSFLSFVLLGAVVVGCGSEEPRTATEGASAQDIAEYEAAVAAAEGSMAASEESSAEEGGTTVEQ